MQCVELRCSGRQLERAHITLSREGVLYRVTCGPLEEHELTQLTRTAAADGTVRLSFPESGVVLTRFKVESPRPGWVVLEGFVVSTSTVPRDKSRQPSDMR